MVSTKVIIIGVIILAFVVGGGIGVSRGAFDRLKFEANKIRSSLNERKNGNG